MNWDNCAVVERNPNKLGGVPILKRSRVQADAVWENYLSDESPEEIAWMFGLKFEDVCEVIRYAEAMEAGEATQAAS